MSSPAIRAKANARAGRSRAVFWTAALCLCLLNPPTSPAQAGPRTGEGAPTTTDLLTFIRALEAPGGYDDYERRIALAPPVRLTAMTVGAVLDWQDRVRRTGAPSTAAGGYQIIHPTLSRLVRDYGIDRTARFDAAMQDRLARLLVAECGSRPGPGATAVHPRFGNCLATIWAALPLTSGPNRGLSVHHGVAGNRALTTSAAVLTLLGGEAVPLRRSSSRAAGLAQPRGAGTRQPLAFGTVRVGMADVGAAMRGAARTGSLTPSVRTWEFDPYASQ